MMNTTAENARIENKTQQIIDALRSAGTKGLTNAELSTIALRYGGSLGTLYHRGYEVKKTYLGNGLYNYVLTHEPDEIVVREKAMTKLMDAVAEKGLVSKSMLAEMMDNFGISVKYKANTYKA